MYELVTVGRYGRTAFHLPGHFAEGVSGVSTQSHALTWEELHMPNCLSAIIPHTPNDIMCSTGTAYAWVNGTVTNVGKVAACGFSFTSLDADLTKAISTFPPNLPVADTVDLGPGEVRSISASHAWKSPLFYPQVIPID